MFALIASKIKTSKVSRREMDTERTMEGGGGTLPTGLSSMMPWALVRAAVVAADMVALDGKKRRRNEMVGDRRGDRGILVFPVFELKRDGEFLYSTLLLEV